MSEKIVIAENLRKSYKGTKGGERVVAVNDISFSIASGEIFAFLGPNGAGKTSTIKMLSGLLLPSTGTVRLKGLDPFSDPEAIKHMGSVLEGNRNLYWRMTSYENLVYFGILKGMSFKNATQRSEKLLKQFNISEKRNVQVRYLSRGMQQKVAIAVSLVHSPALLLLDEPALGLDAKSTNDVKMMIKELASEGVAVLLTTHQFNIAEELSDRVAIINKGVIINEESTEKLMTQHSNNIYEIHLLESLNAEQEHNLKSLPYKSDYIDKCITINCGPEDLYTVFSVINPIPLQKIIRHKSDLSSIFLKLTESNTKKEVEHV